MPMIIGDDPVTGRTILAKPSYTNPTKMTVPAVSQTGYMGWGALPTSVYGDPPKKDDPKKKTGGSSGGGSSAASMGLENAFVAWFGYVPSGLLATARARGWNEDNVRQAAAKDPNSHGAEIIRARQLVRQVGALWYNDPRAVPDSIVESIISAGLHGDADYLTNTYFPALKGAGATNPAAKSLVDYWISQTGRPMTQEALSKMSEIVGIHGFTQNAMNAWETWVVTTGAAITGNYGAQKRVDIATDFTSLLGRNPTQAELDPNGSFWNLDEAGRYEAIKGTADYKSIYGGKPAWMTEAGYLDYARSLSSVYTWYYGSDIDVTTLRGAAPTTAAPAAAPVSTGAAPATAAAPPPVAQWKSLSTQQFNADLATFGITATGSGPTGTYKRADGTLVPWAELIKSLPSSDYYFDDKGYHYIQEAGAIDPKTGRPTTGPTKPAPLPNPDTSGIYPGSTATGLGAFNITNVNSAEVNAAIASGLSPSDIQMLFKAHEEAIYLDGAYSATLTEAFGSSGFSHEQWEALARGGEGSGAMRVQLMEAQNRVAFREVWRDYFGTDPSPSDYDAVTKDFVSPGEFAHRMAAKESAKAKIDDVNEVLGRVFGTTVTLADLENLAMGGQDSGILQRQIAEAEKLDQNRWLFKQYYDREPTPADYAAMKGYAGPEELQWRIVLDEKLAEFTPDIQETMAKVGKPAFTDEELRALLGEQEGYGELRHRLKTAEEEVSKKESSIREAHTAPKVATWYVSGPTGAIKEGAEGLADIGE